MLPERNPKLVMEDYLTPDELADQLNINVRTLADWRWKGEGPPRTKVAQHIFYPVSGVRQWLEENTHCAAEAKEMEAERRASPTWGTTYGAKARGTYIPTGRPRGRRPKAETVKRRAELAAEKAEKERLQREQQQEQS